MSYQATCSTCKKVLTHNWAGEKFSSQTKADMALKMHIGRVHKKNILNGHKDSSANEAQPGETQAKRAYTRKLGAEGVCFCPRCGLNIKIAQTALTVALRHS